MTTERPTKTCPSCMEEVYIGMEARHIAKDHDLTLGSQLGMEDRPVIQTLNVSFTDSEAFIVHEAIATATKAVEAEMALLHDIIYGGPGTSFDAKVNARAKEDMLRWRLAALRTARIAMADAGL
jgi:hypothetical protein